MTAHATALPHMPLSVLELSPIAAGSTGADALQSTVALGQHAEALGFTRFWLAEHHNSRGIASSSPAVLIAAVAAATERIRVGSGGVMLPNHPPLVVAEQFSTLQALYPGRIDLGIGRAPGTDPRTARALRRSVDALSADDFPEQLSDLISFFRGEFPEGHPYESIAAVPATNQAPPLWLLGSSGYSAQVAGMLGLPFAFAHHFSARNTVPAMALYRQSFRPSEVLQEPYAAVAVRLVLADDDEQARWLAGSSALAFLRQAQGRPGPLPTPQEAATYQWSEPELAAIADRMDGQVVGGPKSAGEQLARLVADSQADELIVTTMIHDPADRARCLTLLRDLVGPDLPQGLGEIMPVRVGA